MITVTFKSPHRATWTITALQNATYLDEKELRTWDLRNDPDGTLFLTHSAESEGKRQYEDEGYIEIPDAAGREIVFNVQLTKPAGKLHDAYLGIYQGRFIQLLWGNFGQHIDQILSDRVF